MKIYQIVKIIRCINHRCGLIGFHSRFWKTSQELGLLFYSTWEVFQRGSAKSVHINNEKQEKERESDKALLGSNVNWYRSESVTVFWNGSGSILKKETATFDGIEPVEYRLVLSFLTCHCKTRNHRYDIFENSAVVVNQNK